MGRLRRMLGVNENYRIFARLPIIIRQVVSLNWSYYIMQRTPVLVYSMERTGTVALYVSLAAAGQFAVASHYLDPAKDAPGRRAGNARWASKHIIARRRPAKIITLVRNPVENMLSVFARNRFVPVGRTPEGAAAIARVGEDQISSEFAAEYLEKEKYRRQLDWFDTEYRSALGVDVYQHPFDKERGYARITEGPWDILVVRTELDDERKARAVGEFLGLASFRMIRAETVKKREGVDAGIQGEKTVYGDKYKALKAGVVIPQRHWLAIADSPFARHFFTEAELEASRERFANVSPAPSRDAAGAAM